MTTSLLGVYSKFTRSSLRVYSELARFLFFLVLYLVKNLGVSGYHECPGRGHEFTRSLLKVYSEFTRSSLGVYSELTRFC